MYLFTLIGIFVTVATTSFMFLQEEHLHIKFFYDIQHRHMTPSFINMTLCFYIAIYFWSR